MILIAHRSTGTLIYTQIHDAFLILDLHLTQIVLKNTREDAILDLIFSSDSELFLNGDTIEPLGSSDHNMILVELDLMPISLLHRENHMPSRDYQKTNWLDYQYLLSVVNWKNIIKSTDVDVVWNNFCTCLNQIINLSILLKKHTHRNKPLRETADVRLARAQRNIAKRTFLADRAPGNKLLCNEAAKNLKNSQAYTLCCNKC